MQPIFRFAPSPNGALHLGHALSALINHEAAKRTGGRFLLRLEDIDTIRCTEDKIDQMLEDLAWLGLQWEEPVIRQSDRFDHYTKALEELKQKGLIYPSVASRKDIQTTIGGWREQTGTPWPEDPDGAPLFPRTLLNALEKDGQEAAWRLDMTKALATLSKPLFWQESGPLGSDTPGESTIAAVPEQWGDVVLGRKDCGTSYHLSVVIDDAAQGITHVVRGQDLFEATSVHRLLQTLLDLPAPCYHHHRLLTSPDGDKLSKSRMDLSLRQLRQDGVTPNEVRRMIELSDADLEAFMPEA
ncbi:tRNA glutamyl-Q(34) synthetase GluQRS [uncultured Cohaesibacter sp.]|uniref:tRNA glutamyl-Q(34) synthetase GluQRS n=1 Tax=uncultured Cohaesibacter sp. TaxID=1002546 RepID=UPI0029C916C9|nr:tRNA glutamyl-Q(34) synthetase GluQRS [uncultured Cohaesibacter sp.]